MTSAAAPDSRLIRANAAGMSNARKSGLFVAAHFMAGLIDDGARPGPDRSLSLADGRSGIGGAHVPPRTDATQEVVLLTHPGVPQVCF
jgi:hypothetical protein